MKIRKKITTLGCLLLLGLSGLCSCGSPSSGSAGKDSMKSVSGETEQIVSVQTEDADGNRPELIYQGSMNLQYAEHFYVDYYEGGYKMLTVKDGTRILTVPEGMKCGDIDPRCQRSHGFTASDKALAVGGGVLEAVLALTGALREHG